MEYWSIGILGKRKRIGNYSLDEESSYARSDADHDGYRCAPPILQINRCGGGEPVLSGAEGSTLARLQLNLLDRAVK